MKYRHVIFDLDGTVVDNEYIILQSLQETLQELTGELHPHEELTFSLGIPAFVPLERYGLSDIPAAAATWLGHMSKYAHLAKPFPEVALALGELRAAGFTLGVVTSRTRDEYVEEFLRHGLSELFGTVICATDTVRHKPHPDPMLEYLKKSGCAKEDAIYVGDSEYDMECAIAAGVDCGHALWGSKRSGHPQATYHFTTPTELLACVRA